MKTTGNPINKRTREFNDADQTASKRQCVQQSTSLSSNYKSFLKIVKSHEEFCFQKFTEVLLAQRQVGTKTLELGTSITFFCVLQTSCQRIIQILSDSITDLNSLLEECKSLILHCMSERKFLSTLAAQLKLRNFIFEIDKTFIDFKKKCLSFIKKNTHTKKEILKLGEACLIFNEISFAIECFRKASSLFIDYHDDYLKCCFEIDELINKYNKILKDNSNKNLDPLLVQYKEEISKILKESDEIASSSDNEGLGATQPLMEVDETSTNDQNRTQEHPSKESSSEESSVQESLSEDTLEEIITELQ